jgi:hypothetical protein
MLMENAIKHTKDVFITFLRLYFNNPKNYKNKLPRQISDNHFTEAVFYDSEPEELRKFPTVILSATSGNMITSGLGDMCSEVTDPRTGSIIAYRYQGFYEFTVTIDIGCKNPLDREVFTDLITKALRFSLRRYIQNQGIIIKDASYAGETTIDYNSDKIYISQVRFNTWSTWIEDVDLLDPNEFNMKLQFGLEDIGKKTFESTTVEKNSNRNGENKITYSDKK